MNEQNNTTMTENQPYVQPKPVTPPFPESSLPYYQMVEDVTDVKLNPFSETLRVASEVFLKDVKKDYTIRNFFDWTPEQRKEYFEFVNEKLAPYGYSIRFQSSDGDFHVYEFVKDDMVRMLVQFYLRDGYEKGEEGMKFAVCELNFTKWDVFAFTKCPMEHNFFDFIENGEAPNTMDLMTAILLTIAEWETFLREYKSRMTIVKNCTLLADKLCKAIVENYDVCFRQYEILATAEHNGSIYARRIPYEGYALNYKDFTEKLKAIVDANPAK